MMRWRRHVRNWGEALLCARIAGAIPLVWLGLHVLPLPRVLAWLTPRSATPDGGSRITASGAGVTAIRTAQPPVSNRRRVPPDRIIYLTALLLDRPLPGIRPTCLLRSLVVYHFLRGSGVAARLHLGVTSEGDALVGHAWLTLDGHPLLEPADPVRRFRAILSFPEEEVLSVES